MKVQTNRFNSQSSRFWMKMGLALTIAIGLVSVIVFFVFAASTPIITTVAGGRLGSWVQVRIDNLPANVDYVVYEGKVGTQGIGGTRIAGFNSLAGGTQYYRFELAKELMDEQQSELRIVGSDGSSAWQTIGLVVTSVANGTRAAGNVPVTGATATSAAGAVGTATPLATSAAGAASTATSAVGVTATVADTATPLATSAAGAVGTATPLATSAAGAVGTATPLATATVADTSTPLATSAAGAAGTATPVASPTVADTSTPLATSAAGAAGTATPLATATVAATATPLATSAAGAVGTATPVATATAAVSGTATVVPTTAAGSTTATPVAGTSSNGSALVPVTGQNNITNMTFSNQIMMTRDDFGGVVSFLISNLPLNTDYTVRIGPANQNGENGYVVAHFNTGSQTSNIATFEIPVLLRNEQQLDLRMDSQNQIIVKTFPNTNFPVVSNRTVQSK